MKTTVGILVVVFFAALGMQVNAQNAKRNSCVNGISNLTEQQKTSISELETTFQKQMADYRAERQATTELEMKKDIREKMLTTRAEHQKQVNGLLNADQQQEYSAWLDARKARGNNMEGNMGKTGKQGKKGNIGESGKGKGNGQGKGRGACLNNN